jgi:hypothetical protein
MEVLCNSRWSTSAYIIIIVWIFQPQSSRKLKELKWLKTSQVPLQVVVNSLPAGWPWMSYFASLMFQFSELQSKKNNKNFKDKLRTK